MYFKRLKDLREDNDLRQDEVAKLLNITRQLYGLYESGKSTIPIYLLIELAKFYNVSIDYIVGISNQKKSFNQEKNMQK
ncbi:MAG: helix-turn-helix transcriptional regulator [Bacilli bacterium]|nr:helix-turn-helix transcriptional regulator [Bacilli bacterium]